MTLRNNTIYRHTRQRAARPTASRKKTLPVILSRRRRTSVAINGYEPAQAQKPATQQGFLTGARNDTSKAFQISPSITTD